MGKTKILLGLSFYKQVHEVANTLSSFVTATHNSKYEIVLGLQNDLPVNEFPLLDNGISILDTLKEQKWPACYLWDATLTSHAMKHLDERKGLPFFNNFSYGSAVNRLLILAKASGSDYFICIDPGTGCPPEFDELIDIHLTSMREAHKKVVSAQYSNRLAIRDDFVSENQRSDFYKLIHNFTGIDPAPGRQLTSGAALTLSVDGPLAIAFDGAKVWASDDGFFQVQYEDQTEVQNKIKILREKPGFELTLSGYLSRVAGMVVLNQLVKNSTCGQAWDSLKQFLDNVQGFISNKEGYSYDNKQVLTELKSKFGAIVEGYINYKLLKDNWKTIVDHILNVIKREEFTIWS